jgi:hypothetical protein
MNAQANFEPLVPSSGDGMFVLAPGWNHVPSSREAMVVLAPGGNHVAALSAGPAASIEYGDSDETLVRASRLAVLLIVSTLVAFRGRDAKLDSVSATGDGGIAFEFHGRSSGREIVLVVPADGLRLYFVARSPNEETRAGLVDGLMVENALPALAGWLASARAFPEDKVRLG